ncbi:hypothetical protein ABH926_008006 [Catenulispora sp. GP43]
MPAIAGTLPGFRYPAPPMLTSMSAISSATQAAHALLAEGAATPEKTHNGINPPLNGAIVLVVLLILLFVTTRLNRDR